MDIDKVFSSIFGFLGSYDAQKKGLFDSHVAPLMADIEEIHRDYISAFLEIRLSLQNRQVPKENLLQFLEDRRHQLASKRNLSKRLAEELSNAERRVVRKEAWMAFKNFCAAVEEYFEASDQIGAPSWYTQFISFMRVSRLGGFEGEFFNKNVFGNDPLADMIFHIDKIVEQRLPAKLNNVHVQYAVLRSSLL